MPSPSARAKARSQLMHLLAQMFTHPLPEFHQQLVDGEFQTLIAEITETLFGNAFQASRLNIGFSDYESQYIDLFQTGKNGRPAVSLNAGDYSELLDGQPRTEHLLDYSNWYKHFGLKVRQVDQSNELPDHLVCQLEFLAWLAHLESGSIDKPRLQNGYQRAQRDFIQRQLEPLLALMIPALARQSKRRNTTSLFSELGLLLKDSLERTGHELNSILGPVVQTIEGSDGQHQQHQTTDPVDIWS